MEHNYETKRICNCPLCYMVWTTYDKYQNCKQKIKNKINKSTKYKISN